MELEVFQEVFQPGVIVSFCKDNDVLLSAVYIRMTILFYAEKGKGAFENKKD